MGKRPRASEGKLPHDRQCPAVASLFRVVLGTGKVICRSPKATNTSNMVWNFCPGCPTLGRGLPPFGRSYPRSVRQSFNGPRRRDGRHLCGATVSPPRACRAAKETSCHEPYQNGEESISGAARPATLNQINTNPCSKDVVRMAFVRVWPSFRTAGDSHLGAVRV